MAILRSINHPGVEIREIDKSQIAPAIVGTYFYLPGFTDKGEEYEPNIIGSMSDYTAIYGTPTNEAEKYHYYATREVIRNNGTAVCSKLPYANALSGNYRMQEISITSGSSIEAADAIAPLTGTAYGYTDKSIVSVSEAKNLSTSNFDTMKVGGWAGSSADFVIVNQIKSTFSGTDEDEGLFVAVVDPYMAMNVQRMLPSPADTDDMVALSGIRGKNIIASTTYERPLTGDFKDDSLSEDIMSNFPAIDYLEGGDTVNPQYSQYLGLVVLKTFYNDNNAENISVGIVEAFVGSIFETKRNKANGLSEYLVDIVNNGSQYIRMFKNPNATIGTEATTTLLWYQDVASKVYDLLGFTVANSTKYIDGSTIATHLNTALEKVDNINNQQIDVVVDAGLSTIAQQCAFTEYNPTNGQYDLDDITSSSSLSVWRNIESTLEQFCSRTRKDCMCILDAPRHLVLDSNEKYIRKTAPTNTFSSTIGQKLRYITGINSSYAALYINWFAMVDEFTGRPIWVPETVKVAGVYAYSDSVANMWDAPAGLNRGIVNGVYDLAFNPNKKDMDQIYTKSLNYAVKYPLDGFIVEGQKTTQVKPSAFDRVNVRRMFLRLERATHGVARYFVYEPNNLFTRRRLIDVLTPMFQAVKAGGGLYDYRIVCDETNNTPDVIDANELKVAILLKPVRTAEYILVDFVATRTDANFDEVIQEI